MTVNMVDATSPPMTTMADGLCTSAPSPLTKAALYAKEKGLKVISVCSMANAAVATATHSSGKRLCDVADLALDNCVPPEDSLVDIGYPEKVSAGSAMAAVFIAMALVAETAARLVQNGIKPHTFVSPNVPGVTKDHNLRVFDDYSEKLFECSPVDYVSA